MLNRLLILLFFLSLSAVPVFAQSEQVDTTVEDVVDEEAEITPASDTAHDFFNAESPVVLYPIKKNAVAKTDTTGWYVNEKIKTRQPSVEVEFGPWFSIIGWSVIIGLLTFILFYFLLNGNWSILKSSARRIPSDEDTDAIHSGDETNPDAAIRKALAIEDYRTAVRFHYLKLLQQLAKSNYIQLRKDATASVYYQQLKKHAFASEFLAVNRYYEYVWYGKNAVSLQQFYVISGAMEALEKKLN